MRVVRLKMYQEMARFNNPHQEVRIAILYRRSAQLMDLFIQCVNGKTIIN